MKPCTGLFDHSLDKLVTTASDKNSITKRCPTCGYQESLPRSHRVVHFFSNNLMQTKKWAADDNRKELLQPMADDGTVNEEFTEAYGFNPFDERTKATTPKIQGGLA